MVVRIAGLACRHLLGVDSRFGHNALDGVLAVFPQVLGVVLEGHGSVVGGFHLPPVRYVTRDGCCADLGSRVVVVGVKLDLTVGVESLELCIQGEPGSFLVGKHVVGWLG